MSVCLVAAGQLDERSASARCARSTLRRPSCWRTECGGAVAFPGGGRCSTAHVLRVAVSPTPELVERLLAMF